MELAREIAMDIWPIETILKSTGINQDQFESIQKRPLFQHALTEQTTIWQSALSSQDRLKIKAATTLEVWLPELSARLHDKSESLSAKIEGGKLLAKISGADLRKDDGASAGEKFSITINLGAGNEISIEKPVTQKVIEAKVVES